MLFERISRKLNKTELTSHVKKVFNSLIKAVNLVGNIESNLINVGLSTTAAMYLLSPIMAEFKNLNKGFVNVSVCSDLQITLNRLLENKYEIAIIHNRLNDNRFLQFEIAKEKLLWVTHCDFFNNSGCLHDARQYPLIAVKEGCIYQIKHAAYLNERANIPIIGFSDTEAIKSAVMDRLGVGMLPETLVERHINDGSLVKLQGEGESEFILSVVVPKQKNIRSKLRAFLKVIVEKGTINEGLGKFIR